MVFWRHLTFIACLVLLIKDNQPESFKRRKKRGARTDYNIDLPVLCPEALVVALPRRHTGVQNRNPVTEAPVKAKQGLVGQCNLRNQHYNLPARAHHLLDHREIHLCFSAAGHPVNQVGFMHPRRQIRGNPVMYFLLAGI